jgi:hypothetical protein
VPGAPAEFQGMAMAHVDVTRGGRTRPYGSRDGRIGSEVPLRFF